MSMNTIAEFKARLGFDVDLRGIREFEKRLNYLKKRVDAAGSKYNKSIVRANKTQVEGLTAVERRLNRQKGLLFQLRNDYWKTNNAYRQGTISYEKRGRVLNDINHQYREQKRLIIDTNREVQRQPIRRIGKLVNRPVRASSDVSTASSASPSGTGIGVRAGGAAGLAARLAGPAAVAGAAVAGTGMAAHASNRSYQRFESIRSGFIALEGSSQAANKRLEELGKMAEYFGQQFLPLADGYKSLANNLKGSSIEDESLRIYTGLQAYGTAMGLNQLDLSGIQLAIGQIAAAGKVQGDELNQLAERGISRNLLADAMGITLEEFMERQASQEGIQAKNILPALGTLFMERANVGGALDKRRESTQAEANRAVNQATFANIYANTSGIDAYFKEFYRGLQELLEAAMPLVEEIGEAFKGFSESSRESLQAFGNVLGAVGNVFDSMDGVEVSNGVVTLAYVLNNLAGFINDVADTIDLIRSDESWKTKLSGVSTTLVNQLERVVETFINAGIDKVNFLLPKSMEISPVSFEAEAVHTPTVDLSGVNELLGNINTEINTIARETIKPLLNAQGGLTNPDALLFGPPVDRQGNSYREVNQENHLTVHVDGAQDSDAIVSTIQERVGVMFRESYAEAMSDEPLTER